MLGCAFELWCKDCVASSDQRVNDVVKSRDNKRFVDLNPDRTVLFAPSLNALVAPRTFLAHTYTLLSTPHTKLCDNLLVAHSTRNVTLAACTTPTTKMAFYKCKLQLRSLLVA